MSNITLNGASLQFARSLEVDTIPEKLRCATCDKLAIHAVRLSCCDSTICGDCKDNLTATECPICSHSPFSADTCTPAKALQTTVKVFIKNEAKKRSIDITGHTAKPIASAAPAETVVTPSAVEAATATPVEPEPTSAAGGDAESTAVPGADDVPPANGEAAPELQLDHEPQGLPLNLDTEQTNVQHADAEDDDDDEDDEDDVVITTERPENEDQQAQGRQQEQYNGQTNGEGESSEQNMQMDQQQNFNNFNPGMGSFGNMHMNGFNPMMAMPNFGMGGMPNMMGMPGMGMDPSMMFGGNFGGMGDMSAMMGMGMGNMGGDMSGMGNFGGMGGPGFFPNQGNYMQSQNYGNAHRQNFYNHDRGYGRGYGRGFGRGPRGNQFGRGRGGWNHQQQYGQNHQQFAQGQSVGPQQSGANTADVAAQRRGSPTYGPNGAHNSHDAETNGDQDATAGTNQTGEDTNIADDGKDQVMQNDDGGNQDAHDPTKAQFDQAEVGNGEANGNVQAGDEAMIDASGMQGEAYGDYDPSMQGQEQQGYGHQGYNNFSGRGGFRGRGGYQGRGTDITDLTPTPAPPVNAPKGPKAMREGRPNTGWAGRRNAPPAPTPTPAAQRPVSQARSVEQSKEEVPKTDAHDCTGYDRNRSASRSPSHRRSSKDRDRPADGAYDSDENSRHKERERRKRTHRNERHDEHDRNDDKHAGDRKYRSRSESRTDDSSRRRHRDKDDEHRSSRLHRDRSKDRHKSRRHRSKSPAKDYSEEDYSRRKSKSDRERETDYDDHKESRRSRKSSRREDDYQHDEDRKDRSHRSSRYDRPSRDSNRDREREREAPRKIIEPPSDELGFKIKGSKSARAEKDKMAPPMAPASASADPYAEERARAQQGREAREAQRRMSTQSSSLGKRGREEEETFDAPRGPKGDRGKVVKKTRKERRMNVKYEDELGAEDDDRYR